MIGFGVWQDGNNIAELHIKKAGKENLEMLNLKEVKVLEIDDDELHIREHTAFLLSLNAEETVKDYNKICEIMLKHINEHKTKKQEKLAENE